LGATATNQGLETYRLDPVASLAKGDTLVSMYPPHPAARGKAAAPQGRRFTAHHKSDRATDVAREGTVGPGCSLKQGRVPIGAEVSRSWTMFHNWAIGLSWVVP